MSAARVFLPRTPTVRLLAVVTTAAAVVLIPASSSTSANTSGQWPMFGQNVNNTASASTSINTANVGALKPKWTFTTGGDVSARAAVVNGVAYVPDWSGHLYAIRSSNGKQLWAKNILTDYLAGVTFSTSAQFPQPTKVVSRTSPAVDPATDTVYIGTQRGAFLLAVNATTGALRWRTQLDPHIAAIDTASPVVADGVVYTGVASLEEAAAVDPSYPCCTFRGSAVAVDAATGQIRWQTYMTPQGYNGVAVWGSTLIPDVAHNAVYVTTGNNYFTPTDPAYTACIADGGTPKDCQSPDNHVDSVLRLNLATGQIVWATRLEDSDDWNVACFFSGANCPVNSGPDFDFGSGANLVTIQTAQGPRTILGAGQKSGVYSAFDPETGQVLWATQVGPGSSLGGIEWGSATDGTRIYVAIANFYGIPYTLPDGSTDYAGSWAALNPATGAIIWQVADPNGAIDLGPVTVANGVVYAGSMAGGASDNNMYALNARTGATLWSFASGASVIAGATVANDTVFWGSGYSNLGLPGYTANNKLFAFTRGGQ